MSAREFEGPVVWPKPREDPQEEPSHNAARILDRDLGIERGDFFEERDDPDA